MKSRHSKRIVSALLTTLFISTNATAFSSEISGIKGNNGVYNINPSAIINGTDIGYRKYKDFNLDKGDVANLIYKYGESNIETFMNLVDNKININGLVNSMRDGNFYNGKAIFVSPNGMVVGSSGVLNVGSLSVTTPTLENYNYYKDNPNANIHGIYETNSNSNITIDGKVITTNNVDLNSGRITLSKDSNILAGTGNNTLANTNAQADALFNNLVNTNNIKSANNIGAVNGNITINSGIGTKIAGTMQNFGKGDTKVTNNGTQGILISGKTENLSGNTEITNNKGTEGINITGSVYNKGTSKVENNAGLLHIGGNFTNEGDAYFTNNGTGAEVSGTITNKEGKLAMLNNKGALNISEKAAVKNEGTTTDITTNGEGGLNNIGRVFSN